MSKSRRGEAVGGRDIAAERGLDRLSVDSIYDGCQRLLAELGLDDRAGDEHPRGDCLLTGLASADATRAWLELTNDPAGLVRAYFATHERVSNAYDFNPFR